MCSRSTGSDPLSLQHPSVCTCLAMAADTHSWGRWRRGCLSLKQATGSRAEANGGPSIEHILSARGRGTGRVTGHGALLKSSVISPSTSTTFRGWSAWIHATYSSISQTSSLTVLKTVNQITQRWKKKKSCSFHAFSTTLRCPTPYPYFRVSRDQGNSYFLLFTGMNDPLLDTEVLEYWECHI